MEEHMTSMQLSPLSSQKTTTEEWGRVPHNIIKGPSFEIISTQSIHYVSIWEKGQLMQAYNTQFKDMRCFSFSAYSLQVLMGNNWE